MLKGQLFDSRWDNNKYVKEVRQCAVTNNTLPHKHTCEHLQSYSPELEFCIDSEIVNEISNMNAQGFITTGSCQNWIGMRNHVWISMPYNTFKRLYIHTAIDVSTWSDMPMDKAKPFEYPLVGGNSILRVHQDSWQIIYNKEHWQMMKEIFA